MLKTIVIRKGLFLFFPAILLVSGCAVLHSTQVGDIDASGGYNLRPFTVMVSETGVNLQEGKNIAKAVARNKDASKALDTAYAIVSLFQQGPRTGNPVFDDTYATAVVQEIYKSCPSGKITGVTSIRETRKYPVISGEIVKIRAFCMETKS